MLEIMDKITQGDGNEQDISKLKGLANLLKNSSLCGLGLSAPNPVLSTLRYFYKEYEAHILDRYCPAGVCTMKKEIKHASK